MRVIPTRFERLLAVALLALALGTPLQAQAQPEEKAKTAAIDPAEKAELARITLAEEPIHDLAEIAGEHQRRRSSYTVAKRVGRYGVAATETIEKGEPEKGLDLLTRLDMNRLNPMERAQVYQVRAYVEYELGNTDGAIASFEKVLEQQVLDPADENRMRFNIAQLRASQQDWGGTIRALRRWSEYAPEKDPLAYYLMAIAQYQIENMDAAIVYAEKAVAAVEEPKEGWLQLLAALYVQKEDFKSAVPVLEQLVVRFPKKPYWVQLSLLYGALEQYQRSLAVQQVAYAQGLLTENEELLRLARSYLYANVPYRAAQVLEKGLKEGTIEPTADAYQLLANSWIAAREYDASLPPLRKAAEIADTGDLYVRIGQVHMQREEWSEAADMLRHGLDKGNLEDQGQALLLLGIAYFNAEQVGQARSYFARALQHADSRAEADRWIKHIDEAETSEDGAPTNPS